MEDDVDDLLNLIEGNKASNTRKPPLPKQLNSPTRQEIGGNKFLDEFLDEDPATSMYVPLGTRDAKRSNLAGDDAKKRSALFGSDQSMQNRTVNSIDYGPSNFKQRPQTSDAKGQAMGSTGGGGDNDIGEINLTVSRRGGRAKPAKDRPFTSPGVLEKPESQVSEDRSVQPDTPNARRRVHHLDEDANDGDSDYLSAVMNRDRVDSRKSLATTVAGGNLGTGYGYQNDTIGSRTDLGGRKDYLRPDYNSTQDWITPVKKNVSDFGGARDAYSQNTLDEPRRDFVLPRSTTMNMAKRDYLDTASQLMSQPTSVNNVNPSTNALTTGGGRRARGDAAANREEPDAAKAEEEMTNLLRMQSAATMPQQHHYQQHHGNLVGSMNMIGTPNRDASILIQEGTDIRGGQGYVMLDTAGKDYIKETEEHYKRENKRS